VGFAIHNTTEGLAIVAPLRDDAQPGFGRLLSLGLIAGVPAILGAWIGASAFDPSLVALLFGVGVGAIVRVIVQIAPAMRDGSGRYLTPLTVAGILAGIVVMYLTGLLVSV
ncbi:MAG TPA: ZIP family metal transporter, partial [Solirubrobacterales bacterium]